MSACDVRERGAALLITVLVFSIVAAMIAAASMELAQQNTETAAQLANYNEARTAALTGIAGFQDFLNEVQNSPNTATAATTSCGTNGLCSFVSTLTNTFWGNSSNDTVVPPNGGLGAIGYFNGQEVSINNVSLKNASPYINATVSLHIIGNTYQIDVPATNNTAEQPAQPGLITVISQGISGQASATAQAVLGPVLPSTPESMNTTLSLNGTTNAGQIVNEAPSAQHTYLQAQTLITPSATPPSGFSSVITGSTQSQVTISANTLAAQANIEFLPPNNGQSYPNIEFSNVGGNSELGNGPYQLTPNTISQGVCTFNFFGYCFNRVPIFASGTSINYQNGSWTISNSSGTNAILIPGAAFFQGNVTLSSGTYDNAIISTGNIVDDGTVYAPNYAGPSVVCGSKLDLYPTNFCGPQGTQFIPGSIGNIALYSDGTTTIGNNVSVYGDILSRGDLNTDNLTVYGFLIGEGTSNSLNGTTTINNESAPESFNPTPLNASQYSATVPATGNGINEPIGLLGLTWIN